MVVLAKNARFQIENPYFFVLGPDLKDSFLMHFFRLTNEEFLDMGISKNCKLRVVIDEIRPLRFRF
jgi:hypothetical protein